MKFWINGKNIQVKKLRIFICMLLNPKNLIHSSINVIIYVMDNSLTILPKDNIIIKYVKKPSSVVPVNCKELVDELYETHISDNQHENKQLQKNNS